MSADYRAKKEKRRREDAKARLREHKRTQVEIESHRTFWLQRELRALARKKREKALQDYIR